jgi:hypothetical protein
MIRKPEQQKKLLAALLTVFALLAGYRYLTSEEPRTAPLTYARGTAAVSSVRTGIQASAAKDPLQAFLVHRDVKFAGVTRDLFRMENPVVVKVKPVVRSMPTPSVPPPPAVPEKTPQEIAADAARADLAKFRFLGYVTDRDSSLFLSKDGEVFIVRSGDAVLKNYRVKEAGRDYVVLLDTATSVEKRIELSGGADPPSSPQRFR